MRHRAPRRHRSPRPAGRSGRRTLLRRALGAWFAIATVVAAPGPGAWADTDILVFAAASMTDAMTAIAESYSASTGIRVALSFASSSALARQIENGAPAAVFVSANRLWMDRLVSAGLIAPATRTDLAANRLALIAPRSSAVKAEIGPSLDLAALLGDGRLAIGDPDHVPAGLYGRAALDSLGLWRDAAPRLARTSDVRGALALVARGETPLGLVYATDATVTDRVRVVGLFPPHSHPPIVYPAALTATGNPAARRFLTYLEGPEARAILSARGFAAPPRAGRDPAS